MIYHLGRNLYDLLGYDNRGYLNTSGVGDVAVIEDIERMDITTDDCIGIVYRSTIRSNGRKTNSYNYLFVIGSGDIGDYFTLSNESSVLLKETSLKIKRIII